MKIIVCIKQVLDTGAKIEIQGEKVVAFPIIETDSVPSTADLVGESKNKESFWQKFLRKIGLRD